MNSSRSLIWIFLVFSLAGCAKPTSPAGAKSSAATNLAKSQIVDPSPSITITPTITTPPTFTPTSGPPPDLELKNVTIYPETFDKGGQKYFLLGRVRNNTDQIMVFRNDDVVFKFIFEVWEFNSDPFALEYRHVKYSDQTKLGNSGYRTMNCILYPGDDGVFYTLTLANRDNYILYETMKDYSGPLGIWYSYDSFYRTQSDIPLYYHPKTENILFTTENGEITFDYDIVDIPNLLDPANVSQVYSWLVMYNKDGKIINIFYKRLAEMPGLTYGGDFHVHGTTGSTMYDREKYFDRVVPLTSEMVNQVDTIEVFNEFEEDDTCYGAGT